MGGHLAFDHTALFKLSSVELSQSVSQCILGSRLSCIFTEQFLPNKPSSGVTTQRCSAQRS
jgi:hypothetical protein